MDAYILLHKRADQRQPRFSIRPDTTMEEAACMVPELLQAVETRPIDR